tara:strand:+ start:262 stop:468 length:207 start_codon:yes stop_codon:yes gene_type:complete
MNDTMMYQTMYNESVRETSTQKKVIEEMKVHIEILTTEMELYKTKMRKELLRLQIKLGEKNDNDWVDY